ncbi:hypothetical protein AUEXF2481DRAFT_640504 [Aureobasidium subglaciale EXF-2481]|uniref:Uncharacterized protein n=1 Tax=Aureobasidium subglaciale (strain EXF-2481) TaxID=1043005 RepID=A0A074ZCS4_AURSE|nr:uncharacterized protein AUEXF2481DRAFT_640504 [Aureobasidium subglaciale EXF-2481]KEQ96481.1 hypothetical protein AUEXF2481DRAFT_640504 [Aureobasidium subglaciale EXF-2481]
MCDNIPCITPHIAKQLSLETSSNQRVLHLGCPLHKRYFEQSRRSPLSCIPSSPDSQDEARFLSGPWRNCQWHHFPPTNAILCLSSTTSTQECSISGCVRNRPTIAVSAYLFYICLILRTKTHHPLPRSPERHQRSRRRRALRDARQLPWRPLPCLLQQ